MIGIDADDKSQVSPDNNESLVCIARLRILIGYLGEKGQHDWWPSEFFSPSASAFLKPVFSRTTGLAQYQGAVEAARRAHDEGIGVGRVFHLFRLPESLERALFDAFPGSDSLQSQLGSSLESQDAAKTALRGIAGTEATLREGPVQIGTLADLDQSAWLSTAAGYYCAAFDAGARSYPYLVDSA